jgi:hypothetical protein
MRDDQRESKRLEREYRQQVMERRQPKSRERRPPDIVFLFCCSLF